VPTACAGRAEQQRRDAGGRDDHPERERPDAPGRRLDRRVRELARCEEPGCDERRPRVDRPGVEQRPRVLGDDEAERELEQRAPAPREPDREREQAKAPDERERRDEPIGDERAVEDDRREGNERADPGQRALRA
jgi:hypothetical protein